MKEIWKDIPEYEDLYQASNWGRVRSLHYNHKNETRILKQVTLNNGYSQVELYKNGIGKKWSVHRLIYITFIGSIPEGMQVNHINENKSDNRLENLNLMTQTENMNWGTAIERMINSRTGPKARKIVLQFDLDGNFIKEYPSQAQVQKDTGFKQGKISMCCTGKRKTAYGFIWSFK